MKDSMEIGMVMTTEESVSPMTTQELYLDVDIMPE